MSQTNSLKGDSDSAFIQQPYCDLVAVANTPQHSVSIHDAICKRDLAGAAGAYAELVLVAADVEPRIGGFNNECGDSFVPKGKG